MVTTVEKTLYFTWKQERYLIAWLEDYRLYSNIKLVSLFVIYYGLELITKNPRKYIQRQVPLSLDLVSFKAMSAFYLQRQAYAWHRVVFRRNISPPTSGWLHQRFSETSVIICKIIWHHNQQDNERRKVKEYTDGSLRYFVYKIN